MSHIGTTAPNGDPDPDSVRVPGTTIAAAAVSTSAYVRQAKPSEIPALVAVYVRAFARDPAMNWFGSVRTLVPADYHQRQHNRPHRRRRFFRRGRHDKGGDNQTENEGDARARRTVEALGHFQLMLVKMAQILRIIVVIVEKEHEGGGGEKEKIVGGALWLRPGSSIDPSPLTFMRISPWRALWNWGLTALKVRVLACSQYLRGVGLPAKCRKLTWAGGVLDFSRVQKVVFNYSPTVNKIFDEAFAERGLKPLDSWHLFEIAVDPTCEGKGAT
jgi:hypothetical protein